MYGNDVLVLIQTLVQSAGDDLHIRILGKHTLNALRSRDDVEEDDPFLRNDALLQQLRNGRQREHYADHFTHASASRQHGITNEDILVFDALWQLAVLELGKSVAPSARTRARLSGVDSSRWIRTFPMGASGNASMKA